MARLAFLAAALLAGCPAPSPSPIDAGGARDTPEPRLDAPPPTVDAPGPGADAPVAADAPALDTPPVCPDVLCVNDLGGSCCGTETRPPVCPPTGATCDPGFIFESACRPAAECAGDWRSCEAASDCVLAQNDCCGWCGGGHATDVDAVNELLLAEHEMEVCPVPMICPRCATGPMDPNVIATCSLAGGPGRCAVVDLGPRIGTCATDTDCEVVYRNCCGCSGTDDEVTAVRAGTRSEIDALLCDGGSCPLDCAPQTPPGWRAFCDTAVGLCRAEAIPLP